MNLDRVGPGKDIPNDFNVIIEIPSHSDPVKYEVDKETGAMFVDRFMNTAMHYPCNYGYIPKTLSEDGDPVDVLVVTPIPLISGSVIRCRSIAMLEMEDESGPDAKILAVPIDKLCTMYRNVHKAKTCRHLYLSKLSTFSNTTRISKKINGSRSRVG
jgi:inorganic pyrophosphatase